MREANWGRIVNVASAHGLVASAQKSAYVAAKHGIVGFTKSVALETATTGITSNAICPGWVLTQLVQKQIDDRAAREGISATQAQNDLLGEKAAFAAVHDGRATRRPRGLPVLAGRRPGARRGLANGRRLDSAIKRPPPSGAGALFT
jgi:NAD(P)-dependent dehydrogenase (short-subunit alcohol dehydrogenase family)